MKTISALLIAAGFFMTADLSAQFKVSVEPDTILCVDGEARITVQTTSTTLDLNCVARKGGGDFTEFKLVDGPGGKVQQAAFTSPFPGEIEIDVLDGRFNKVGVVDLTVMAPVVEIRTEDMYDSINFSTKSMPLVVSVMDHRDNPVKNARLVAKITEVVNKKQVASNVTVSPFIFRNGKYVAYISNLKQANYHIMVYDMNHTETFDRAVSPDIQHPGNILEGMSVEFD